MASKLTCSDFNVFLKKARTYIKNEAEIQKIVITYEYVKEKHDGQFRQNGDPYLYHLLSTAYNLAL